MKKLYTCLAKYRKCEERGILGDIVKRKVIVNFKIVNL